MTFGLRRAELAVTLVNCATRVVIGVLLVEETVDRFLHPRPNKGGLVIVVTVRWAWRSTLSLRRSPTKLPKESLNIRAAVLHDLADPLGAVAVIGVGRAVILFDRQLADPPVTTGIAAYILTMAAREIRAVIRILMLGSPRGVDPDAVARATEAV